MGDSSGTAARLRRIAKLVGSHGPAQTLNKARFEYGRVFGFRSGEVGFHPPWLPLFITERCNLRCQHCRCSESCHAPDPTPDMSLEQFEQILDMFPEAVSISLTGGEPFLHGDVFEMLEIAHRRRLEVYVPTNGTLLHRDMDRLLEAPIDFMNISLYGVTRSTFSSLTGVKPKLFDQVLDGARELIRRRRPGDGPKQLRASYICTKPALDQAFDLIEMCRDVGFDQVKLKNLEYDDVPYFDESLCLYEDDPEVQVFLDRLRTEDFGISVQLPKPYSRNPQRRSCDLPFRSLVVDGAGSVGPCCVIGPSAEWGNVAHGPAVWNNPRLVKLRRSLLDESLPLLEVCRRCEENRP